MNVSLLSLHNFLSTEINIWILALILLGLNRFLITFISFSSQLTLELHSVNGVWQKSFQFRIKPSYIYYQKTQKGGAFKTNFYLKNS